MSKHQQLPLIKAEISEVCLPRTQKNPRQTHSRDCSSSFCSKCTFLPWIFKDSLVKEWKKLLQKMCVLKKSPIQRVWSASFLLEERLRGKKYPRTGFVQCFADDAEICCKAKEIFVLTTEPKCEIAQMLTDWFKSSQGSPSAELRASSKEKSTVFMNLLCFPLPTHSKSLMSSRSH